MIYMILRLFAFLITLQLLLLPGAGRADEFRLTPSAAIAEKYNDNILFSEKKSGQQRDWVTVVSPGLDLVDRTERLDLLLSGRLNGNYYSDLHNLNAWDQFYNGHIHYGVTDKLGLGADAGYLRDSQPDRDIDVTGLILTTVGRQHQNYGGSIDYRLLDTTTAALSYRYDKEQYDEQQYAYTDWWGQTAGLGFVYDMGKWLAAMQGRLNFGYANYNFTGNVIDSYTGTLGFSKDFSEKWSVLFDAGARFTRATFEMQTLTFQQPFTITVSSEEKVNEGWGGVGQLTVAYKDYYTTGNITVKKDILPASGYNGATDRTFATFDLRQRFTYELSGFLRGGYYMNKSDAGQYSIQGIDERTASGTVGLRYDFTKDIYLEASYNYTRTEYLHYDTYAERNLVLMKLYLQHSFFE